MGGPASSRISMDSLIFGNEFDELTLSNNQFVELILLWIILKTYRLFYLSKSLWMTTGNNSIVLIYIVHMLLCEELLYVQRLDDSFGMPRTCDYNKFS